MMEWVHISPDQPKVSLGVPVYNGEPYLPAALDAILAQTFSDFEVIICDNASTDRTAAIAQDYVARDKRFRYYRNEENIGAARNFNRTFELASGEYFKWCAADDLIAPNYLETCVAALDANPAAALCYTRVKVIDDRGKVVGEHLVELEQTASDSPSARFGEFIRRSPTCFQVFGLFRADVLRQTTLITGHIGADKMLIAEICLRGPILFIPEHLFFSRQHGGRSVKLDRDRLAAWYDPRSSRSRMPTWRRLAEFLKIVARVPLSREERWKSYWRVLQWALSKRNLALFGMDFLNLIAPGSWSRAWNFYERRFRPRGYSPRYYRYYDSEEAP